jgi:hypothetical protein
VLTLSDDPLCTKPPIAAPSLSRIGLLATAGATMTMSAAAAAATLRLRDLKSGDLGNLRSCLSSCFSPPQMITALEPRGYSKSPHTFVSET